MNLKILSDEEKREMQEDARDVDRGKAFETARIRSHEGSLDEYIDLLSETMMLFEFAPSRRITENCRL
ncbi:MAG: hypothetical protein ACLFVT_06240 [Syntrophobacteria bacterium]